MQRPLNKGISSTVGIAVRTGLLVALFFGPRCVSTNGARTMDREFLIPGSEPLRVIVREGDITLEDSDAIVNAANTHMMGGSGVDGAVHSRAGPELLKACIALPIVGPPRTRVRTGDAVLLPGFRLKSKYVIAAVGPVFSTEEVSVPLFRNAINRALQLGKEEDKIASISFPALSCGVYGFPPRLAAETFFTLIRDKTGDASASTRLGLTEVRVVLFGGRMFRVRASPPLYLSPSPFFSS